MISTGFRRARTGLREGTSRAISEATSDILSRAESAGVTYGSGLEGVVGKETGRIRAGERAAEAKLGSEEMSAQLQALLSMLGLGYQGLSSSSTFGDILAGLTTFSRIGSGVALGLGQHGLGLFGTPSGTNVNVGLPGYEPPTTGGLT